METEFKLPEMGENIESGKVVSVLVKVGDVIELDQPVIEVETEKTLFEVPSTLKGTVKTVHAKEGEEVGVGQVILTVETGDSVGVAEETSAPGEAAEDHATPPEETAAMPESVVETVSPAEVQASLPSPAAETPEAAPPTEEVATESPPVEESVPEPANAPSAADLVPASPSVRRLARGMRVDITQVEGTALGGRISADDVKNHAKRMPEGGLAPARLPDFSKWGKVESVEMDSIRRAVSRRLSLAWSIIPHVTQCEKADITEVETFRKKFGPQAEAAGGKLTVTAILLKITAAALKVFPKFAASIDPAANRIIYKKYAHIGVAVDTEHGLLVPVIRDADRKSLIALSVELGEMAGRARQRRLTLEDMEGACITITNLGGIGGTYFTPIVNWPEAAILGVSRAQTEPVFIDGEFRPRLMLPIQVSYDHRLIDGADGIRLLRWIADALENPFLVLLDG